MAESIFSIFLRALDALSNSFIFCSDSITIESQHWAVIGIIYFYTVYLPSISAQGWTHCVYSWCLLYYAKWFLESLPVSSAYWATVKGAESDLVDI